MLGVLKASAEKTTKALTFLSQEEAVGGVGRGYLSGKNWVLGKDWCLCFLFATG